MTLTQSQPAVNFMIDDGAHYDPEMGEWVVIVDGDEVGWFSTQQLAWNAYHDMLRVQREHIERNPANIPFEGEPVPGDDEYGLEARG